MLDAMKEKDNSAKPNFVISKRGASAAVGTVSRAGNLKKSILT